MGIQGFDADTGAPISLKSVTEGSDRLMAIAGYSEQENANRISSVQNKLRCAFYDNLTTLESFDIAVTGAGMTQNYAGTGLAIATGTTLDDKIVLLSKKTFTIPIRAMIALSMSQRIAGQSVTIELVSIDTATGIPDGKNVAAWTLMDATATQGVFEVACAGSPRIRSAASTIPTTASMMMLELEPFADEVWFHARAVDSTAARANTFVKHLNAPDPTKTYKLRITVENRQRRGGITAAIAGTGNVIRLTRTAHGLTTGNNVTVDRLDGLTGITLPWTGTVTSVDANTFELQGTTFAGTFINNGYASYSQNVAPASTTTVTIGLVAVLDFAELTAEITAGRGQIGPAQALAVLAAANFPVQSGQGHNVSGASPYPVGQLQSAWPATGTTGRAGAITLSLQGQAIVKPFSIPELDWQYAATGAIVNTTDVAIKAAAGASVRNYLTSLYVKNTNAVATEIVVKDGSTVIWRGHLSANMVNGETITFPTPLKGTANTALNFACITTAASVYVNAQGFAAA